MTAATTVGFAPATAPVLGASAAATTTASQPAGEGGLFAALLALLAPGASGGNLTDITLPDAITAPLHGFAQAKDLLPKDLEARLTATAGKLGIDLASLGDMLAGFDATSETPIDSEAFAEAVTSLVEALAARAETPTSADGSDIAGIEQLEAAVDNLLALIGAAQPAPPPQPTTGEAFSALVGELTEALTGPGKPASDAAPSASLGGGDATDTSAAAGATTTVPHAAKAPDADGARAPLVERLVQLLDDTAKAMAPANPQLAEKLAALAKALPALPDDMLTALDAATTGNAGESTPQLASLIEQAMRPRATTRASAAPAFATLGLELPTLDATAAKAPVADADANPAPKPPAPSSPTLDSAPAAPTRADAPAPAPTGGQQASATAPAETSPDKPADTAAPPTQAAAAAAQQSATPPAALRTVQAAYQPPATPINLPQVAFEIVRQVQAGNSRFQIRLDPAELGRIDVQLDVDRTGNVSARMVVERPETLDLMQRDQRALQQALQQAGLDANRTSLEFSLRQNPFAGDGSADGRGQGQPGRQSGDLLAGDSGSDQIPEIYRGTAAPGALNLFV